MLRTLTTYGAFLGAIVSQVWADCTRPQLQEIADSYLVSQSSGQLQQLLSSNLSYVQNNKTMDINSGILKRPLTIAHNRSILDTIACATYTEVIVTNLTNAYVIGTQIHTSDGSNGSVKASLIDSVVTSNGDWLFNATKTLSYVLREDWGTIAADERDTRATLRSAADAYLDLWGNPNATVPWGEPCERLEGSGYTGNGSQSDSCNVGIPGGSNPPNTNRRYVVDETIGSVSVLCIFQTMGNASDSHEFRLEGGKLRHVHTMTVMH